MNSYQNAPCRTLAQDKSLAEGNQHFLRRKNRDGTEPAEILDVECERVPDSMHVHRCHQARVMDLDNLRPSLQQRFCATPEALLRSLWFFVGWEPFAGCLRM